MLDISNSNNSRRKSPIFVPFYFIIIIFLVQLIQIGGNDSPDVEDMLTGTPVLSMSESGRGQCAFQISVFFIHSQLGNGASPQQVSVFSGRKSLPSLRSSKKCKFSQGVDSWVSSQVC